MMRWLVGNSIRFRFIVLALAAAMVVFGMEKLRKMPPEWESTPTLRPQTQAAGPSKSKS